MQPLIKTAVLAAFVLLPAFALAQSSEPVTRAQVRAELVQLEKAGYDPHDNQWGFPYNLQRAEATVAQQQAIANATYGIAMNGAVAPGK